MYRPSESGWYVRFSASNYSQATSAWYQWGLPSDIPLVSDFDGDGRTDLAVYRPSSAHGTWRISSSSYSSRQISIRWGLGS